MRLSKIVLTFPRWTLVLIIASVWWTGTCYCPRTTSNHAPIRQSKQSSAWVLGRKVTSWKKRWDKQIDWCWFHGHPSYFNFGNCWFGCLLAQGFYIPQINFMFLQHTINISLTAQWFETCSEAYSRVVHVVLKLLKIFEVSWIRGSVNLLSCMHTTDCCMHTLLQVL